MPNDRHHLWYLLAAFFALCLIGSCVSISAQGEGAAIDCGSGIATQQPDGSWRCDVLQLFAAADDVTLTIEPRHPSCLDTPYRWFTASTPDCKGIVIQGETRRAWLCARDLFNPDGKAVRLYAGKDPELVRQEALMRNAMTCMGVQR